MKIKKENKDDYKKYREELITHITEFVDRMKQETRGVDDLVKTTYTPDEVLVWRHDVMKESMNLWFDKYRALQVDYKHLVKKYQNLQKEINRAEKQSMCRQFARVRNIADHPRRHIVQNGQSAFQSVRDVRPLVSRSPRLKAEVFDD